MELSLAIFMFAGSLALGSVGSTATLAALYTGFLIGVSGCINVLVALHCGADNKKEITETIHTAGSIQNELSLK